MPIGNTSGDFDEYKVFLNPKGLKKEAQETYFQITEYVDTGFKETNRTGFVTAYLDKIYKDSYDYDNKTIRTLKVELVEMTKDKPTRYIIEMNYGNAARELLNRLANLAQTVKKIDKYTTIGIYNTGEPKFYKGMWLKYGETVNVKEQATLDKAWGYESLQKKTKKVVVNGEEVTDFTELDKFFDRVLEEIISPTIVRKEYSVDQSQVEEISSHAEMQAAETQGIEETAQFYSDLTRDPKGIDWAPPPNANDEMLPVDEEDDDLPF